MGNLHQSQRARARKIAAAAKRKARKLAKRAAAAARRRVSALRAKAKRLREKESKHSTVLMKTLDNQPNSQKIDF